MKWEMGRVVKARLGADNLVSVVDLHTNNALIRRAIPEISPLHVIQVECFEDINNNKNFTSDRITRSKTKIIKICHYWLPILLICLLFINITNFRK